MDPPEIKCGDHNDKQNTPILQPIEGWLDSCEIKYRPRMKALVYRCRCGWATYIPLK